jgi:CRISPR/Cas system CMR-associated protein Cmr5 small subunit
VSTATAAGVEAAHSTQITPLIRDVPMGSKAIATCAEEDAATTTTSCDNVLTTNQHAHRAKEADLRDEQ